MQFDELLDALQKLIIVRPSIKDIANALGVQDKAIIGYRKSGNKTYTEYEDGTLIIVDFEKESVSVNENEYYLSDYTVNGA